MFDTLIKRYDLSFRNLLYFIAAMPLATTLKVNIGVLEVSDFAISAIILLWFSRRWKPTAEKRLFRYFSPVIMPFCVFMTWALFTSFMAYEHVDSDGLMGMFLRVIKMAAYMFIFWIMATESILKKRAHRYIFWGFVAGLALNGLFIFGGYEGYGNIANVLNPESNVAMNEDNEYTGPQHHGGLGMANPLGSVLACYLIYLIALFLRKKTVIVGGILLLLLYSLVIGVSRGAWATFLFGLILFYGGSRYRIAGLLSLLIVLIIVSNAPIVQERLFTPQEGSYDGQRAEIAAIYLKRSLDDPVFGKGFYSRFYRSDTPKSGTHNQYIQTLFETGFIGLLLYIFALMQMRKFVNRISDRSARKLLGVVFITQLFSVLSGEFWYGDSIFCAQIMLYIYIFLENSREEVAEIALAPRKSPRYFNEFPDSTAIPV
jgi:O-antigen ligase